MNRAFSPGPTASPETWGNAPGWDCVGPSARKIPPAVRPIFASLSRLPRQRRNRRLEHRRSRSTTLQNRPPTPAGEGRRKKGFDRSAGLLPAVSQVFNLRPIIAASPRDQPPPVDSPRLTRTNVSSRLPPRHHITVHPIHHPLPHLPRVNMTCLRVNHALEPAGRAIQVIHRSHPLFHRANAVHW